MNHISVWQKRVRAQMQVQAVQVQVQVLVQVQVAYSVGLSDPRDGRDKSRPQVVSKKIFGVFSKVPIFGIIGENASSRPYVSGRIGKRRKFGCLKNRCIGTFHALPFKKKDTKKSR